MSKKLISQILIAGVHNSIGRAAAIGNQQHRALQHFENAITIGTPGADRRLLTQARINEQHSQLGLPPLTRTAVSPAPTFLRPPAFRITTLAEHTARLKTYDETTQSWADHPQAILSGSEQKPWTSNAYWNHPAVGMDGSLHLSFVWRTHTLGEEQRINNINIGYACSSDNGLTWQTSHKRPYKLPITQVNAETIHPVSPGSNLINQTSMALDSQNRPHIVFYADDPDGVPQYQHLWFDGKVWHQQIISNRTEPFSLHGGGTLQIPISRPDIVIDRHDNVYVITRGNHTQNRLAATLLPAPNYTYQPYNISLLAQQEIGFAEPIIDRERWQHENILTILLQHNEQPNHDTGHREIQHPASLIDMRPK